MQQSKWPNKKGYLPSDLFEDGSDSDGSLRLSNQTKTHIRDAASSRKSSVYYSESDSDDSDFSTHDYATLGRRVSSIMIRQIPSNSLLEQSVHYF